MMDLRRVILLASLLWTLPSLAQEYRATLLGMVTDPSGAVVAGARVAATNLETGVPSRTEANREGNYLVPFLQPGNYRLRVEHPGFKTYQRSPIEVRVNDRVRIDVALELGESSEHVTVNAEAPLLQTASATLGQVIDARRVADLPVRDGSPFSLTFLSPGVMSTGAMGASQAPIFLQNGASSTSVSGSPLGTTEFTIDGAPNMQSNYNAIGQASGIIQSPPADMVQEFKLETAFDASVGHTSGTIVNFVLKTGTNQLHATALFSYRDPDWGANTFIANRAGQPRGDFYYKRWSATARGPVYIPKIYNGKDRTFFSFGYEQMPFTNPGSNWVSSVPTTPQLHGDFSQLLKVGSQYQIYDPATTVQAASGRLSRSPFPGNIIPQSRLDPIALTIAKQYPSPNVTGQADGTNNFAKVSYVDPRFYYNYIWRIDEVVSEKQRIYARFAANYRHDAYRKYFDSPAVGESLKGPGYQATVDDVYMLSPTLIMNMRYNFNRLAVGHWPDRLGFSPSALGFPPSTVSQLTEVLTAFPDINVSGITRLGGENITTLYGQNHSGMVNFTKQSGPHSFKFGVDARSFTNFQYIPTKATGQFSFSTTYTKGPLDNSTASPGSMGQALASLFLGIPTGGGIDRNTSSAATSTYWALFFHDNWRVSRKLTVDLGLRWEYEGPVTERFSRSARGFDFNYVQPINDAARAAYALHPDAALPLAQFNLRGGLTFAGVNGQSRLLYDRAFLNFAPRAGFAYQMGRNTVVRGGFGVYPIALGVPAQGSTGSVVGLYPYGYSQTTSLISSLDNGRTYIASLAQPFPTGIQRPAGNTRGAQTYLGQSISFNDTDTRTPYSMRWSMNIQRLLPGDWLVEAGYVGSKSLKLTVSRNMDAIPAQYLSTSAVRDQTLINYMTANIPNPMANLLPGTSLNGATIARAGLLVPYPEFAGISMLTYQGSSWYNSAQLRAERRMKKGFTIIGVYTFSKLLQTTDFLNAGDPRPSQYVAPNDCPHVAHISGVYDFPFGRGRAFLPGASPVLNSIVGGWTIGAIWSIVSGPPVMFSNPLLLPGMTAADVVLPKDQRTLTRWFNTAAFDTKPANQLSYNRVSLSPYLGVRGDYETQLDVSMLKKFRVKERYNFQLRGEFINLPNHPTFFAPPDATPTSTAFGTVTAMKGTARVVQIMLKVEF